MPPYWWRWCRQARVRVATPGHHRTITCPPQTIPRQHNFGVDREDLLEKAVAGGTGVQPAWGTGGGGAVG
ncbi:hypothetical protein E2C01_004772 [Portunus trituberculatus]|uniref:Uncharacterized protein n=1 Tax=Portunus trituberculatus TaxID=210409 RepID=A0A5B7CS88_PORTR|nr:hypothetical protein [Portunus trituberculatus]